MIPRATLLGVAFSLTCFNLPAFAANEARTLNCVNSPFTQATMAIASSRLAPLSVDQLEALAKSKRGAPEERVALRALGERYQTGTGVERDLGKAADFYRRAAFVIPPTKATYVPGFGGMPGSTMVYDDGAGNTPGDLVAMNRLARMYLDGDGVKLDAENGQALLECSKKLATEIVPQTPAQEPPYFDRFKQPSTTPVPNATSDLLDHEIRKFSVGSGISDIAWSPDGKFLAVSHDEDRKITLFSPHNGRRLWTTTKLIGADLDHPLTFSPDGSQIYTASAITIAGQNTDKTVSVINTKDGQILRTLAYRPPPTGQGQDKAQAIATSRDGSRIFVSPSMQGDVILYETKNWDIEKIYSVTTERVWGRGASQVRLLLDENRDRLWISHSGLVREVRLSDGHELANFQTFEYTIVRMELNAVSGEIVVGGSAINIESRQPDGTFKTYKDDPATLVRAYDPQTGKQTKTYPGPGGSVRGLSVSADGKLIAASKSGRTPTSPSCVLLWNTKDGGLLASKGYGQSSVSDVAFSPDGSTFAYTVDNVVHLVTVESAAIAGTGK